MEKHVAHASPCAAMQAAQVTLGVVGERLDGLEEWQKRQNGSLVRLAATAETQEKSLWQLRLGIVVLVLLTGSQHPVLLKLLGL